VKLELLGQAPSFVSAEGLVERGWGMRVEVVEDDADGVGGGITLDEFLHLAGEVSIGTAFAYADVPVTHSRFKGDEQRAVALTLVLVILALGLTRLGRQRRVNFCKKLVGQLVKAARHGSVRFGQDTHDGSAWVIRFGVEVEHVFHAPDKISRYLGDAPLFRLPRLKFVFLSVLRTVSSLMLSTVLDKTASGKGPVRTLSSTSLSASSCIVQLSRSLG